MLDIRLGTRYGGLGTVGTLGTVRFVRFVRLVRYGWYALYAWYGTVGTLCTVRLVRLAHLVRYAWYAGCGTFSAVVGTVGTLVYGAVGELGTERTAGLVQYGWCCCCPWCGTVGMLATVWLARFEEVQRRWHSTLNSLVPLACIIFCALAKHSATH